MFGDADLEIRIGRRDESRYDINLDFITPNGKSPVQLLKSPGILDFNIDDLPAYEADEEKYGRKLAELLFGLSEGGANDIGKAFEKARGIAETHQARLRIRFRMDPDVEELHALRWETLRDPADLDVRVLASDQYIFSRFMHSSDLYQPQSKSPAELKALVVIANPSDLADDRLEPVKVDDEMTRAKEGLGEIPFDALASEGSATLQQIKLRLEEGYDIFYLVCHGKFLGKRKSRARLWLEDDDGYAALVSGDDLITALQELQNRPALVVLASCQSAGSGEQARADDEGSLAALGPRMAAKAGIPAVIAMQGNVTMATVGRFIAPFFKSLRVDGV